MESSGEAARLHLAPDQEDATGDIGSRAPKRRPERARAREPAPAAPSRSLSEIVDVEPQAVRRRDDFRLPRVSTTASIAESARPGAPSQSSDRRAAKRAGVLRFRW
jgi:hypothetical protein